MTRYSFRLLLTLLSIPTTGCVLIEALTSEEKPSARIVAVNLDDLALDSVVLGFDVEVTNPYNWEIPLVDLRYDVGSGGSQIVSGATEVEGSIPGRGSRRLRVPARIDFAGVLKVLRDVRPGALVPYDAVLVVSVDVPVAGKLDLPLEKQGEFPIPTVPDIELSAFKWQTLSLTAASATLDLEIRNANSFAVGITNLNYDLSLGDRRVASSSLKEAETLPAGESKRVRLEISLSPSQLGFAALQLFRGSGSDYRLGGRVKCTTPFGPLDFPFDRKGNIAFSR